MEVHGESKNKNFILENSSVKLSLDRETGSLLELFIKPFHKDLLSFKLKSQFFRIVYALEDCRSHHFDTDEQKISDIKISNSKDRQAITILYDKLRSQKGVFKVIVRITIELKDNSDDFYMWIEVENKDKGEITQVWFPWVRGLTSIGQSPENDILAYPSMGGSLIPNPLSYFPRKGEATGYHEWTRELSRTILAKPYPGRSSMQWMDLCCKDYGIYMACLNKEGEYLVPRVQKHLWDQAEHLSLAMVKYPYIKQGTSWTSPTYILSLHNGDWHVGADKYRQWLETWLTKREKAKWAKETNGFYHLILTHQDGTIINSINDIPEILSEAKAHYINLLFICGWYKGGHNSIRYPDFEPSNPEELAKAIEEVHKAGGHVLLYLNMRSYSMSHPDFKKEGHGWAVKTFDGIPLTESWGWAIPHYPSYEAVCFANMCPSSQGWQNKFIEKLKTAASLGADCIIFDQLLVVDLCHDNHHGHERPDRSYGPGALEMLRRALDEGKKFNPDFELSMEGVVDIYTPYVAIFHSRVDFTDWSSPELFRYTLPWVTGVTGGLIDIGAREKLYQSYLLGLPLDIEIHTHNYGRISFDPGLSKEIKRVNKLRDRHKDLFVNGEFRDNVGVKVNRGDVIAKIFCGENSMLITLWNRSSKTFEHLRVTINLPKLGFTLCEKKHPEAFFEDGLTQDRLCIHPSSNNRNEILIDTVTIETNSIALIRVEGVEKVTN
ncbi:MAG: hypothetical protein H5T85_02790 [Actinobacteria bacterium]|nr:hypothetical protein [Actinomycetota bacterium]